MFFSLIIAWWLIATSMQHKSTTKYVPIGVLASAYIVLGFCYSATFDYTIIHILIYWARLVVLFGLCMYAIWTFRKERCDE